MNREQSMWLRASVALVAAGARAQACAPVAPPIRGGNNAMNREQSMWLRASVALVAAAAAALARADHGNTDEDMPALPEPIAGR